MSSGIAAPAWRFVSSWNSWRCRSASRRAPGLPVKTLELVVRRGEIRVKAGGGLELAERGVRAARQLVEDAQVVARDGLIGHQLDHALELTPCLVEAALAPMNNAEVEPRMGNGRVLTLDTLELEDALAGLASPEQRQPQVHAIPERARSERGRPPELLDRLGQGRRLLVVGLAEIPVPCQSLRGGVRVGRPCHRSV